MSNDSSSHSKNETSDHADPRARSPHFTDGRFRNLSGGIARTFWDYLMSRRKSEWAEWPRWIERPYGPAPASSVPRDEFRVTVINHSTVLIQSHGLNILTDPIYSDRCSPVRFAGPRRVRNPGIPFDALPKIDLILISHDHYDHLDLATVRRLVRRDAPRIFTGLGVGARIASMSPARELDWWERADLSNDFALTFVPTEHFSGRTLWDRNSTLWGGYVLNIRGRTIYFGADSGYGAHYAETFRRFGRMDLALLPIGAYSPRDFMGYVHMDPAQAVRAHLDLQSRKSVGIHYGTFQLTGESLEEPVALLAAERTAAGLRESDFIAPEFGTPVTLPA